jgi:carboxyl-terminal processing protease
MNRLTRLLAAAAVAAALATGLTFALSRHADRPRTAGPGAAAVASNGAHGTALAAAEDSPSGGGDDPGYRLDKLPVLSRAVIYVKENYVDPRRIDPRTMLGASLEAVEKAVAEVMVEGDAKEGRVKVTVGAAAKEFDVSGVDSIWQFRASLGEIMGFIQENLVAHKSLRDIEYAAANGMLSTLDPHSVLLEPKYFKEMKLQTRGEFGGLGFVIGMRDGNLTVMKVVKSSPAQRAGIRAKDVILRIEDQSTINMDLQDAVDRIRGKPGTRVNLTLQRGGWPEARKFPMVRDVINVETVPFAKLLEKNVGYVKVAQFSANTTRDLQAAIAQERAQAGGKLQGLILDLRGNPGGLLEQAIQVSDVFLSSGVIVKTVGEGDRRQTHEVKEAHADRTDLADLPVVVLVNNQSASASEIVAGALKNNNRALVVGRQTFGKGSVQVLYDFADPSRPGEESALKLTIAQYLTPGDVSIQEVGITPDVMLQPGRVLPDAVNWFAPPRSMGEVDLERHFSNPLLGGVEADRRAERRKAERSPLELRYLLDEKEDLVAKALKKEAREEARRAAGDEAERTPEQIEDEEADANPDELVEDYQIRFAKDLLARAPYPDRARQLEAAKQLVNERRDEEQARLQQRLGQLGVDWAAGPVAAAAAAGTPRPVVTVVPPDGKAVKAGETVPWTVTVENRGDAPLYRLRAWSSAEKNAFLDRREFVFGQVKPGQKRSWSVPLRIPRGTDSRVDDVSFRLEDEAGRAMPEVSGHFAVVEQPRPQFAFSVQVEDDAGGNGDGLLQRGEDVALRIDVKNVGSGASGEKTYVSLKNLGDEKVFIKKGRQIVGAVAPGASRSGTMQLEVRKGIKASEVPLRVMVVDEKADEFVSERVVIPLAAEGPARVAADGAVKVVVPQAVIRSGADEASPAVATAPLGAVLPVNGKVGSTWRVEWEKGRSGFLPAGAVQAARGKRDGSAAPVWQREPPRIVLVPDPALGAPVVDAPTLRISGSASVPAGAPGATARLRDVFVFVNDQKVFFRVVPDGQATSIDFATDVPLKPGNNVVSVVAREDEEFQSRRTFVVHRREPAEMAAKK